MQTHPAFDRSVATHVRVLIAEDEALLRSTLPDLLYAVAADAVDVVAECGTRTDALRHARSLAPDVILLDLRMPDNEGGPCTLSGAETVGALLRQSPESRILCLTSHEDAQIVRTCLEAGASGFLSKGEAVALAAGEAAATFALNRLVFLVAPSDCAVGFEVRSLQE